MMKKTVIICLSILFIAIGDNAAIAQTVHFDAAQLRHVIPFGGNAWVNAPDTITDEGLIGLKSPKTTAGIYFRVSNAQDLQLALVVRVPQGSSTLQLSIGKNTFVKKLNNTKFDTVSFGKVHINKPGYIMVRLKGTSKTGAVYADVSDLVVTLQKADNDISYVAKGSSFHFGRRGPSVHLRYPVAGDKENKVKWFYNEIIVPKGQDVIGSYFMADGFGEGYFGMQVNSATERRVLFSVWSPFNTEDPKSIPDSMRIKRVKNGSNVHIGEFGNEGSGGQSYMRFPWTAGQAYAFLLSAEPDQLKKTTTYTAYFKDVAAGKWFLIASFTRPQKATYLTHLYSFVENFEPENGDKVHKAYFTNQWIGDSENNWLELTHAVYTGDATANANYRKDYAGGKEGDKFFLQNGGFFNNYIVLKAPYDREATGQKPLIDFSKLPVK
ncbi:DUF3472 domain-containing protein [Mucilaginibacter sp. cycad4]|uniref:DUF3472 domain-containing protein n=1 Tax=Mucilaginibacter sp. cycad4 TaxID=3342096 RepID=UPI002AAC2E89|nr:DUF3472 domain-containing protein [Mucilaginibacter gossypii]WPV02588.1 DUF3472 domain-containing protein [Mucilaginibacter gossypii]